MLNKLAPILLKHNPQTKIGAVIVLVELLQVMREPTEKLRNISTASIHWTSEEIWKMFIDSILND